MTHVTSDSDSRHQPLVNRPDLVKRLGPAAGKPLTVVRAPAGYGKTEALRRRAEITPHLTAWATPDPRDGGEAIWQAVIAVLQGSPPSERIDSGEVAAGAFRDAAGRWPAATTLVLEDLDRLPDPVATRRQVSQLADALPPNLRLTMTSRRELQLPVGRWRLQGRVDELGPDDLRFSARDTAALLRERGARDLNLEAVRALTDRAEGWPAGVQLLADSDALDGDDARALIDEILRGQPADIQDFLLATSVLGRFTTDLCRAVTGDGEAGLVLREVLDAGLFVVPLDEEQGWFRYNHLFAELLQRELGRRRPDAETELRRRAAAWFVEQRSAPEAVRHLVAAGDLDEAFALVSHDPYSASWGQFLGVPWSELFPDSWIEEVPARMLHFAALLGRSGRLAEGTAWLQRAHDAVSDLPEEDPQRRLFLSAATLWCGVTLHARDTVVLGTQVLQRPPYGEGDDYHVRVRVAMAAANLVLDDLDGTARVCDELDSAQSSEIVRGVIVPGLRARLARRRGELRAAEELAHRVVHTAGAMGISRHPGLREAQFALGQVLAERGDLAGAEALIEQAARSADGLGWPAVANYYRIALVDVRAAAEGAEAGLAVVADLRETLDQAIVGPEVVTTLDIEEARLRIAAGDLDVAAELLGRVPVLTKAEHMRLRLALAQGDLPQAERLWAGLSTTNHRDQLLCDLLGARLAAASGDAAERDRRLFAAARTGSVEGFCRVFVADGAELLPALRTLAEREPHLADLVARVDLTARYAGSTGGALSERETVVLRYLASTLTHNEIAAELSLSTNTVKSHVRALYRKLGVRSRADAVSAARQRSLI